MEKDKEEDVNIHIEIDCASLEELNEVLGGLSNRIPGRPIVAVQEEAPAPKKEKKPEPPLPFKAPEESPADVPFDESDGDKTKEEPAYTMTEVRKALGDLRKAGKKEAVTALLTSMGYSRFTDVPAEKYGELMAKAEEL